MHIIKRQFQRLDGPLLHGVLAGCVILVISALGLFYLWQSAKEAQLDAVRTELMQLARVAATLVNGDAHRSMTSPKQAGSPQHLELLAPLVKFHKATSDIIYVYSAILVNNRIYYVLGTDYLYHVDGDTQLPDPIMAPNDTNDPALRRALELHQVTVEPKPVKEAARSYMSAYAPFYDSKGRFVGVMGVDMWVRDFDARIAVIRRAGIGAFAAVAVLSLLAGYVVFRLSLAAREAHRRDLIIRASLAEAKQQAEVDAQRAETATRAKSDFLAMMSHEIRTPMNGVLGFVNLLLETPLNAEQRDFAETVRSSSDSLLTIINDILDYSKIEAGRMTVEQIDFDLRAVCDDACRILQPSIAERGLAVTVAYDPALPQFICGDPLRLRQVLLNLVGNAVKFTDLGTIRIEVTRLNSAEFKISVVDSGIGISADQLGQLFRRFIQADSSTTRRYGGTGLGLAISKTLVELMGGSIGALSRPRSGSTFWLILPLRDAVQIPKTKPAEIRQVASGTAAVHRGSVLLVEDNFVNQRVAVYMLTKLGATVDVANHGREALELLSRTRYDLVLMDCQMPEMDGFEATRIIRDPVSSVLDHEVPVIAMTANAFPEDRSRALNAGMNDFIAKPVDRTTLSGMLAKWTKPQTEADPLAAAG